MNFGFFTYRQKLLVLVLVNKIFQFQTSPKPKLLNFFHQNHISCLAHNSFSRSLPHSGETEVSFLPWNERILLFSRERAGYQKHLYPPIPTAAVGGCGPDAQEEPCKDRWMERALPIWQILTATQHLPGPCAAAQYPTSIMSLGLKEISLYSISIRLSYAALYMTIMHILYRSCIFVPR